VGEEAPTESPALVGCPGVGVADESCGPHVLKAHHGEDCVILLPAVELDARGHLPAELLLGHVRILPAVSRDHSPVRL
jgi:hypothetical protein